MSYLGYGAAGTRYSAILEVQRAVKRTRRQFFVPRDKASRQLGMTGEIHVPRRKQALRLTENPIAHPPKSKGPLSLGGHPRNQSIAQRNR